MCILLSNSVLDFQSYDKKKLSVQLAEDAPSILSRKLREKGIVMATVGDNYMSFICKINTHSVKKLFYNHCNYKIICSTIYIYINFTYNTCTVANTKFFPSVVIEKKTFLPLRYPFYDSRFLHEIP